MGFSHMDIADQEFREVGHSGGKVIVHVATTEGTRKVQHDVDHNCRPVRTVVAGVWKLSQGMPLCSVAFPMERSRRAASRLSLVGRLFVDFTNDGPYLNQTIECCSVGHGFVMKHLVCEPSDVVRSMRHRRRDYFALRRIFDSVLQSPFWVKQRQSVYKFIVQCGFKSRPSQCYRSFGLTRICNNDQLPEDIRSILLNRPGVSVFPEPHAPCEVRIRETLNLFCHLLHPEDISPINFLLHRVFLIPLPQTLPKISRKQIGISSSRHTLSYTSPPYSTSCRVLIVLRFDWRILIQFARAVRTSCHFPEE